MPKHEEFIALNNIAASTAIALGYQALKLLNWNILFAGEDKILGSTPKTWKGNGQQIYISIEDNHLVFKSELVDGEIFDAGGKNK